MFHSSTIKVYLFTDGWVIYRLDSFTMVIIDPPGDAVVERYTRNQTRNGNRSTSHEYTSGAEKGSLFVVSR